MRNWFWKKNKIMLDHDPPCCDARHVAISNFLIRDYRLICELYILRFVVVVAVECYCQEAARVWLGTNRQPDVSKHNTNHSGKLWSRRLQSIFPQSNGQTLPNIYSLIIKMKYETEKYIAYKNNISDSFQKKWTTFHFSLYHSICTVISSCSIFIYVFIYLFYLAFFYLSKLRFICL